MVCYAIAWTEAPSLQPQASSGWTSCITSDKAAPMWQALMFMLSEVLSQLLADPQTCARVYNAQLSAC